MKRRILLAVLALCLCTSSLPAAAGQEVPLLQEDVFTEESIGEPAAYDNSTLPTPQEIYAAMIALQDQDAYKEGTTWTDDEPYSDSNGYYYWKGGLLGGKNIAAVGCVAFAFILSDTAFGDLPARMYDPDQFSFEDIKVGDILRVNTDTHTVIVLEVSDAGLIVAEGNLNGKVHWGRSMSKDEVMFNASHYITRYPEGYVSPDDPSANESIASGTLSTGLAWNLTKSGTLTISGSGAMPDDFSGPGDQPWNSYSSQIRKIVIEEGVTSIGSSAFCGNAALSVEIPDSVTTIGNKAFYQSSLINANIPSGVRTIGDDAFCLCANLTSVTVSEGVEIIGQRAFQGCSKLASADLPTSIKEMGAGAFYDCPELLRVTFAPGGSQVKMGDDLFARCWRLHDVTLPSNIDCISARMFQNCFGMLFSVSIPQGATKISEYAFAACSSLTTLIIPDSIEDIDMGAFSNCPLANIYFTGTEAQWKNIWKASDVTTALANVTIHYEYKPGDDITDPNPTEAPTAMPTVEPSAEPSQEPTTPSATPSQEPVVPSAAPSQEPVVPTATPSQEPATPSATPSQEPVNPTTAPSQEPVNPTTVPSQEPVAPTTTPSQEPAAPTSAPTATPDTQVPSIKGESGQEGWAAIQDAAANATEGKLVSVNMNGASTVPGNVLDSMKGKNVTISFDMDNGITWLVNGKDVTDHAKDVNLSVEVETSAIPQDTVNHVAEGRPTKQLSLAYDGEFGYSAALMIDMNSVYKGKYANLFHYNESTHTLEFVIAAEIQENGMAKLTFSHASDYVIVVGDNVMDGVPNQDPSEDDDEATPDNGDSQKPEAQSPKTDGIDIIELNIIELQGDGNGIHFIWLLFIGTAAMAAAGTIAFLIYKRTNK